MRSKIRIVIAAAFIIIACICVYFIHDINTRFPAAVEEHYTKDNPLNINGLIITPVESRILNIEEFNKLYPDVLEEYQFDDTDKKRIITYTLTYENTTNEQKKFKPEFSEPWMLPSCFSNGVRKVTGEGTTTFNAGEKKTITLYTNAFGGSQVTLSELYALESNKNYLIYQEYPEKMMIDFN